VSKKSKVPYILRVIPKVFPWVEKIAQPLATRFFVYLFFTPIRYRTPEKEQKAESFSQNFEVHITGKRIQCYQWGNAPKSVLVGHGWAGRATQLRRFVKPLLKAGYQVIGFDGPAHGKSDGRSTNLDEFQETLQTIIKKIGTVEAIIAHSFGGVASLYAISNGLPVKTLVNIASPVIGQEIINSFLKGMNGSAKTGEAFRQYVLKKSGKRFEEFSALEFIKHVPTDFKLLLLYDEDDLEVTMAHPQELLKVYPQAEFIQTKGLGHTRILKDDSVINSVVTFIQRHSSNP
jgi:hypothetical protein